MNSIDLDKYLAVRDGNGGFYEQKRGLLAVWGKESVQFLNGLITNDVAKLEDGAQMLAAFPNAQGRLLAVVRVLKKDDKFLFETEEATHEKVFNNLFRFTFAGDFFAEDLSKDFQFFEVQSKSMESVKKMENSSGINFQSDFGMDYFVPLDETEKFREDLRNQGAIEISDQAYEILRVENGLPLYGFDMDETTIVPELGIDGLISYNKGCYIGQEIIARIYFRGHVAKQLRGLIFENEAAKVEKDDEIKTTEGKNAGRITSVAYSPKLQKTIALAFVRYDYLADETELKVNDFTARVKNLPLVS